MQLLRNNAGLTAQAVAAELDVAESTVRNWDKGRTEPKLKIEQFDKLMKLYKCSFNDLLEAVRNSMNSQND